jgi:hypothetical protein
MSFHRASDGSPSGRSGMDGRSAACTATASATMRPCLSRTCRISPRGRAPAEPADPIMPDAKRNSSLRPASGRWRPASSGRSAPERQARLRSAPAPASRPTASSVAHRPAAGGFPAKIALARPVWPRYHTNVPWHSSFSAALINGCIDMTKIDWESDRRRRMATTAKREAHEDFFYALACGRVPKRRTDPEPPKDKRLVALTGRQKAAPQKPWHRHARLHPAAMRGRDTVDTREQPLEEQRAEARANHAARSVRFPARPCAQNIVIEHSDARIDLPHGGCH